MTDSTPVPITQSTGLSPFDWVRHEFGRMLDDMRHPSPRLFGGWPSFTPHPAVEVLENEDAYRLTAELAGMEPDDVRLEVAGDELILAGEKRDGRSKEDGSIFTERRYGAFERRITLPNDADLAHIEARFDKGMLVATMPKVANGLGRRRIEIRRD